MGLLSFLRGNAPFLLVGALLSFASSFGQTFFISIFAGEIMESFSLSDGEWGLIYTVGTTISAITMVWAGALTDRYRVRALANVVGPGLALACLGMALLSGPVALVFVIFALRLFGQGLFSHLSIVAMARWFVGRRGLALSISSMGFALGQAILPVVFAAGMVWIGWRWLWVVAALVVLGALPILARLLRAERTPQAAADATPSAGMDNRHWTRSEVLRHPLFWFSVPLLLGPPAWGTALFFQQVHFAAVKGWALVDYLALMPVFTAVSIAATFASGALIDRFGTARLMVFYMLPFAIGFFILWQAEGLVMAALGLAVFGIGTGAQATLPGSYWAEFFGTRHIGSIKAMAGAIMVFGSAIGPGITGWLIDTGLTFEDQLPWISLYFCLAALSIALGVAAAQRRLPGAA
ncbi:MFS transporter [Vannielia litorea]|uniref:MFS transporter n=1 Tax=Vannielia litorea TaxID=1217970 RepID=UPI001C940FFB|nr:MFS transporter [Vannielia litorea]MBY6049315.1 MFS transporter [Vannielia litorea]MBY6076729.1 MFS transporter [Vannielia litorea]